MIAPKKRRMRRGGKSCWLARETRRGWRVALHVGNSVYPLRGALFVAESDVQAALGQGIVFVRLRDGLEYRG